MQLYNGILLLLCAGIALLISWQFRHYRHYKNQRQINLLFTALQAYPVHQYQMAHMLERCLAIIFNIPVLPVSPRGAILLTQAAQQPLFVSRNLAGVAEDWRAEASKLVQNKNFKQVQEFLAGLALPIVIHEEVVGVILLATAQPGRKSAAYSAWWLALSQEMSKLIRRKQVADDLALGNAIMEHNQHAILIAGPDKNILRSNPAAAELTGLDSRQSSMLTDLFDQFQRLSGARDVWACLDKRGRWQGEISRQRSGGRQEVFWLTLTVMRDAEGAVSYYVAMLTDLTELRQTRQQVDHLSLHDPITGLPNRRSLLRQLQKSIACASKNREPFALFYLDIDQFKKINNSLGPDAGDSFLKIIGQRLLFPNPDEAQVFHLQGDEFAVISRLSYDNWQDLAVKLAELLQQKINVPMIMNGLEFVFSASVGICKYPDDAMTALELLKFSETAMLQARQHGGINISSIGSILRGKTFSIFTMKTPSGRR